MRMRTAMRLSTPGFEGSAGIRRETPLKVIRPPLSACDEPEMTGVCSLDFFVLLVPTIQFLISMRGIIYPADIGGPVSASMSPHGSMRLTDQVRMSGRAAASALGMPTHISSALRVCSGLRKRCEKILPWFSSPRILQQALGVQPRSVRRFVRLSRGSESKTFLATLVDSAVSRRSTTLTILAVFDADDARLAGLIRNRCGTGPYRYPRNDSDIPV